MADKDQGGITQTFRFEIRGDVTGTEQDAIAHAQDAAAAANGEVTAIWDEGFEPVPGFGD